MPKKRRLFSNYRIGILTEYLAMFLYMILMYRIVGKRVRTPLGEIDIICIKYNEIVFIEVKSRSADIEKYNYLRADQIKRIKNAAKLFLHKNKKYAKYEVRFDIVLIRAFKFPTIIKNAF